jgi:rRNA maturation RNase YbeY
MTGIVRFHFLNSVRLNNRRQLKQFIADIFKREGFALGKLDYIFCSDEYLLKINQDFLQHDDYTDIITFDLSASSFIIGEIYISVDRVKENAGLNGQRLTDELHRVIFHGALHLCGYKDKAAADKAKMTEMEDYYLANARKLFL